MNPLAFLRVNLAFLKVNLAFLKVNLAFLKVHLAFLNVHLAFLRVHQGHEAWCLLVRGDPSRCRAIKAAGKGGSRVSGIGPPKSGTPLCLAVPPHRSATMLVVFVS